MCCLAVKVKEVIQAHSQRQPSRGGMAELKYESHLHLYPPIPAYGITTLPIYSKQRYFTIAFFQQHIKRKNTHHSLQGGWGNSTLRLG